MQRTAAQRIEACRAAGKGLYVDVSQNPFKFPWGKAGTVTTSMDLFSFQFVIPIKAAPK